MPTPKSKPEEKSFKHHLEEIADILAWFDAQETLDVEQALEKMKRAGELLKITKGRLGELENKFKEIKKEIEKDTA